MRDETKDRLYSAYATTHAGTGSSLATRLTFEREIAPRLTGGAKTDAVLDLGCGQGGIVRQFVEHGYVNARGIDISPEQVEIAHRNGVTQVELGDFRTSLEAGTLDVITANDFLEHLTIDEVLEALDATHRALKPGGLFLARTPNLSSPFGGGYRYGDLTHETSFTPRSLLQLGNTAGFSSVEIHSCPPKVHGVASGARLVVWKLASAAMKTALAAETGRRRGHHVTQNVLAVMRK